MNQTLIFDFDFLFKPKKFLKITSKGIESLPQTRI